ncbi:MAG: tRNA epoxyqueuosine(34) reductase QueG [Prolixibacteraceae bacterium]|nr:tRNA epoxyqueuosine(34) reductase QueG [Prolixibacteraceae bacterium]
MMSSELNNSNSIKQKALSLGFSACGIARARRLDEEEARLKKYLELNYNGEMAYMANHFEKRLDPTLLVPGAKSVIVVLLNYYPEKVQQGDNIPVVSKYAYGKDYHEVVKGKLCELLKYINEEIAPANGRCFTDSAPVLERAWAVEAGLGWIGKNGLLLNKQLGSFFFIGELITDLDLDYDEPYKTEHCGTCTRCLDACPTGALVAPGVLDTRRCISYLTIEKKGAIPEEFKPLMQKRIFGCDICQDVCPWNRNIKPHNNKELNPHPGMLSLTGDDWKNMNESTFGYLFGNSAIQRAGFRKLKSNIKFVGE